MDLSIQLKNPTLSTVFTLVLTAGFSLKGWVSHSANAWKITRSDWISSEINTPTGIVANGITWTQRSSIADVEANAGSWAYISGVFYAKPDAGSIHTKTVVATVPFYFANKPKIFSDIYYDPRFGAAPNLSLRIESRFSGVGQIGSGTCALENGDSFFDEFAKVLDWDAGTAVFKMGADKDTAMDFADFQQIGTWRIERAELSDKRFVLTLREPKTGLEKTVPLETYSRDTYPLLSDGDVGKPIPRAYGKVYGAAPVCLDAGSKRFKLAGHAIYDILEVRVQTDGVWSTVNTATRDLSIAEFTLGSSWENGKPVSVDFIGKKRSDNKPMYNASDIVLDLLQYIGESSFDTSSFTTAFNALHVGVFSDGISHTVFKPSLYIDSETKALDVVSSINSVAGSFLFITAAGQWHYEVATPVAVASAVAELTDADIFEDSFLDEIDASQQFSKVVTRYATRDQDNFSQLVERTSNDNRYIHFPNAHQVKEIDAPLWDEADAKYYAERLLTTEGVPLVKYRFDAAWTGFFLLPGDNVHLVYTPKNIDTVVEVLEVRHDLINGRVQLVCGDRRGWRDSYGWWVSDSQAAWLAADSDATKLTKKQSSGFWHGDDNLAISLDGKSCNVSRWY
jgi:hypothetical protein